MPRTLTPSSQRALEYARKAATNGRIDASSIKLDALPPEFVMRSVQQSLEQLLANYRATAARQAARRDALIRVWAREHGVDVDSLLNAVKNRK